MPDTLEGVETLDQYLSKYGPMLGDNARQSLRPLYVPGQDDLHPRLAELLRKPYVPQAAAITGSVAALQRQKALLLIGEMGTGKTLMGQAAVHCHADGRPYRAVVMCPGQLLGKWARELQQTLPDVFVVTISRCGDLLPLREAWQAGLLPPRTWVLVGRDTAKLGHGREAAIWMKRRNIGGELGGRIPHCPSCGTPIMEEAKEGGGIRYMPLEEIQKKLTTCGICEEQLWQAVPKPRRFEPARYIHKKMKGFVDYLIIDECFPRDALVLMGNHEYKAIADVRPGDYVRSVICGEFVTRRVSRVICRKRRSRMVAVRHSQGTIRCTEGHKIYVIGSGYVKASELQPGDRLIADKGVHRVRSGVCPKETHQDSPGDVLREAMLRNPSMEAAQLSLHNEREDGFEVTVAKVCRVPSHEKSERRPRNQGENSSHPEGTAGPASRRERKRTDANGEAAFFRAGVGADDSQNKQTSRSPAPLQTGPCERLPQGGDRGGWAISPDEEGGGSRPQETGISGEPRLGGGSRHQSGGPGGFGLSFVEGVSFLSDSEEDSGTHEQLVYDLEVEDAHSYFADGVLVSNCHEEKGADTAQANAMGSLAAASRKVIAMTGTLIGGYAEHLRTLLWRLAPRTLTLDGFSWKESIPFSEKYGRIEIRTTEKEGGSESNKQSRGSKRSTSKHIRPGIVPSLFGSHLIGNAVFLGLDEMEGNLPPLIERAYASELSPALSCPYKELEKDLREQVKEMVRKGDRRLLSTMLMTLMAYPDHPFNWKTVGYTDKGSFVPCATPESLDPQILYPKEVDLLTLCQEERDLGRQVWVYVQFNGEHDVESRLKGILEQAGMNVAILKAKVPLREREEWIARNGKGVDVMISHPRLVETGLDLFDKSPGGHNFCTLAFYETGYVLPTLRQASRRAWRLQQPKECKVAYFYYRDTIQERAMSLMGQKLSAAEALEGKFSSEGLIALAGDDGLEMALAKSLVGNITESADRSWGSLSRVGRTRRQVVLEEVG